ncbi:hypothetical protein OS493_035466 [Desmophyllum pertusum]|uniref:Uncharacterized protein n=1 Tax=Desmophyllum pertusum TaxID=174260 RepID=A0A9W9Z8H9_9CNID|nr:hypothetical protein OS493_035466 [Desmophyllum pertusum]
MRAYQEEVTRRNTDLDLEDESVNLSAGVAEVVIGPRRRKHKAGYPKGRRNWCKNEREQKKPDTDLKEDVFTKDTVFDKQVKSSLCQK